MVAPARKLPAPPLGVIAALTSGFEVVTARLDLILLPLALDLFLWLGPHLSVRPVIEQLLPLLAPVPGADAATVAQLKAWRDTLQASAGAFNFFAALSTAPLGLPSLMAGRNATALPGGSPLVWLVRGIPEYMLLFGMFVLGGLFLGALYFGSIAQQVRDARLNLARLLRQVWGDWARLTAMLVMALAAAAALGIPVLVMAVLARLASPILGELIAIAGWTVGLWILFYAGFTLHGVILQRRGLFGALFDSLRLVQISLPHTAGLYITVVVLHFGLGIVWNIPADDSWLLLLGLVGHALVSTALVAATFVFYQDRYRWWLEMRQALQAQAAAKRGGVN
jgi:hypothetical protein